MDTLQCAVVLGKLDRFDWEVERRKALGQRYREAIQGSLAPVELLTVRPDRDCVWAQFTVMVAQRDTLVTRLKAQGVPTAVHYPKPLHRQPAYAPYGANAACPQSEAAATRVLSLPMSADLTDEQLTRVVEALAQASRN
jgi:UDP-2-acetamido-2-deoxy-ribo-hexuluronate aminotransferase